MVKKQRKGNNMEKKENFGNQAEIKGFLSILFGFISIISILFMLFFGAVFAMGFSSILFGSINIVSILFILLFSTVFALLGIALSELALKKIRALLQKQDWPQVPSGFC